MIRELRCGKTGLPVSQCGCQVVGVNIESAWGTYMPGRWIEIEPYGWDTSAQEGWGPSSVPDPNRRCLVQREAQSPHPIMWHSEVYDDVEAARMSWMSIKVAEAESEHEAYLRVPSVSGIAFSLHHNRVGGCAGERALADCITGRCVREAVELVEEILSQRTVIEHGLKLIRTPEEDL